MTHPDHMTGAELQTLREACGLSRDELASLAAVAPRTIKHWESGRAGVPADVAQLVRRIDQDQEIEAGAAAAMIETARRRKHPPDDPGAPGKAPGPVLVRARCADDLRTFAAAGNHSGARAPGITWPAQGGAVVRIAQRMNAQRDEHGQRWPPARVVWFDPCAYAAWLDARAISHSGDNLQRWAADQVAAQAMPHRADQPPA